MDRNDKMNYKANFEFDRWYVENKERLDEKLDDMRNAAISPEFLQLMRDSAEVLASEGPYYEEQIRQALRVIYPDDPERGYETYQRYYADIIERTRVWRQNDEQEDQPMFDDYPEGGQMVTIRDVQLKSEAISELYDAYNALPMISKNVLHQFNSRFEVDVLGCRRGEQCNFVAAGTLRRTYNSIAALRPEVPEFIRVGQNLAPIGAPEQILNN